MNLKPIKRKRVYQEIIEQIKESVRLNELKPGDKLPSERELAEKLSVSRSAVREAISVLEAAGLVVILQGIGTFLKEGHNDVLVNRMNGLFNTQGFNLVELLEVRLALEGEAAYLAAVRRTPSELADIKAAYDRMEKAYASHRIAAEEDYEFHIAVVSAAQNMTLIKTVELFSDKFLQGVDKLRRRSIETGKSHIVLSEHSDIYSAIESQDPAKAKAAMEQHLINAKQRYLVDSY